MRLQGLGVHLLYLVLPFCYKILGGDKILQFWAHVFQQFISWCIHILQLCNLLIITIVFLSNHLLCILAPLHYFCNLKHLNRANPQCSNPTQSAFTH